MALAAGLGPLVFLGIAVLAIVVLISAGWGAGLFVLIAGWVGVVYYGAKAIQPKIHTVIEVSPYLVVIDDKKLNRADVGHFAIDHTVTLNGVSASVLGVQYGNTTIPFGGLWDVGKAQEFTSALNRKLRRVPAADDDAPMSPDMLRAARPTDF